MAGWLKVGPDMFVIKHLHPTGRFAQSQQWVFPIKPPGAAFMTPMLTAQTDPDACPRSSRDQSSPEILTHDGKANGHHLSLLQPYRPASPAA